MSDQQITWEDERERLDSGATLPSAGALRCISRRSLPARTDALRLQIGVFLGP